MWRCFPKKARLVCIDMAFQMGIAGFLKFKKTIALMQLGMWLEASEELLDSKYATQTPNRAKIQFKTTGIVSWRENQARNIKVIQDWVH